MTRTERSGGLLARRFVIEVGKMLRKHKAGAERAFDAFCDCITERASYV